MEEFEGKETVIMRVGGQCVEKSVQSLSETVSDQIAFISLKGSEDLLPFSGMIFCI